ncbi:MAG: ATP-binding protein [Bacilli bacterium]|nr:ATP-binding protein [Bacilli bacterium]
MGKHNNLLDIFNKYIASSLITVIKTDKNDEVESFLVLDKYFSSESSFAKSFALIDLEKWDGQSNLDKDIIFIYNYVFNNENDLLVRSIYDDYENIKIFLVCKSSFDYNYVTTHLAGRVELCTIYFDAYENNDTPYSFNDYLYFLPFSKERKKKFTEVKNYICNKYSSRITLEKLNSLLRVLAYNVGVTLSKRKIADLLYENGVFIHKDILGKVVDDLVKNGLIVPCSKYDSKKEKRLSTNFLYFFRDIPLLIQLLKGCDKGVHSEQILLNGVFLELYFSSFKVDFVERNLDEKNYIFITDLFNQQMKMVSFTYQLTSEEVDNLSREMRKIDRFCPKNILSGTETMRMLFYDVTVETVDDYFGGKIK